MAWGKEGVKAKFSKEQKGCGRGWGEMKEFLWYKFNENLWKRVRKLENSVRLLVDAPISIERNFLKFKRFFMGRQSGCYREKIWDKMLPCWESSSEKSHQ